MTLVNKTLVTISTIALALCAIPTLASAQFMEEELQEPEREGVTFGIGVGAGHLECDSADCAGVTGAGDLNGHLGYMAAENLALVGDFTAMAHPADRLVLSQGIASVGPQVWLGDRLWVRAGVGVSRTSFDYDTGEFDVEDIEDPEDIEDRTQILPAATAAAGVGILARENYSLDAQLRLGSNFFADADRNRVQNISLGIGINWY